MVFYLIWNEETLVIKISRKIPFSEEKGITLGQVIENWFRFDKLHSVLGGCSSSTLRAAYTDKEDHTAHTAMDNLHHAIKYLGKWGPTWSSVGALASFHWLGKRRYALAFAQPALNKGNFCLHKIICRSCGRGRCDAPGDQTAPQESCILSK